MICYHLKNKGIRGLERLLKGQRPPQIIHWITSVCYVCEPDARGTQPLRTDERMKINEN